MIVKEIKNAMSSGKVIIGANRVLKNIKVGKVGKVIIASNCPEKIKNDLEYNAKFSEIKIEKFEGDSEKLGAVCRKPFKIAVIGIKG